MSLSCTTHILEATNPRGKHPASLNCHLAASHGRVDANALIFEQDSDPVITLFRASSSRAKETPWVMWLTETATCGTRICRLRLTSKQSHGTVASFLKFREPYVAYGSV